MKRIRLLVVLLLVAGVALSANAQWSPREREELVGRIERVMLQWQSAMRSMDAGRVASFYRDDAMRVFVFTAGGRHIVEGLGPIADQLEAEFRQVSREEPDAFRGFQLPEPEILTLPDRLPIFIYRPDDTQSMLIIHFEEDPANGRLAITRHVEIVTVLEPVEASEEFAWADENENGVLEPAEQQFALSQYRSMTEGPHRVRGPLDSRFDWDGDRRISDEEAARAESILYRDGLRKGYRFFPEFAESYVDLDNSGSISIPEADTCFFVAFGEELELPRPLSTPVDEQIDYDMDGWVIEAESDAFRVALTRAVASIPGMPLMNPSTPAGMEWAVWWADANENGFLEDSEVMDVGITLLRAIYLGTAVSNPVQLMFDRNRDYLIDDDERGQVLETLLQFVPDEEKQWLVDAVNDPARLIGRRPANPLQQEMDTDPRDRRLEEHEVFPYLEQRFAELAAVWLEDSGVTGREFVEQPQDRDFDPFEGVEEEPDQTPEPQTRETPTVVSKVVTPPAVPADQVGEELSLAVRLNPVYPVLRKHYDTSPVGRVTLTNTSSSDLTDIEVSLSMSQYIDQPRTYDKIEKLVAGESVSIDLTLLFNTSVLEITEGERVDATVTVSYSGSAGASEESATETLVFYDRNAIRWDDTRKVAAFVTERDEEIRSYARRVIAGSRDERNDAVDAALQDAMTIFIAMVESDLMYFRDPTSSYASASTSGATIDYMQFPRQTLTDYGGDCDDLSVCFNALLESVGRRTAFITVPGHIMPAVALQMTDSEARSAFLDPTDLVFDEDGTVWVPIEITALEDSFYEAWQDGAQTYRQYAGSGQAEIIPTESAWSVYESIAGVVDDEVEQPDRDDVSDEFAEALAEFVSTQIASRELQIQADLQERPGDRRLLNRLGVLYAQYGIWDKARVQFEAIVESEEYIPALLNLGHIEFLDEEYRTAASYYDRVLAIQSDHPNALLAAARAHHELENYGNVNAYYAQLRTLSPRLAADYAYLDLSSSNETARAQAASELEGRVIWEESE